MATVFERLRKVIVDQLDVEEKDVTMSTSLVEDLEADSLDLVELITAIEEEFNASGENIEISDEDAEQMITVQSAVKYLNEHGIKD